MTKVKRPRRSRTSRKKSKSRRKTTTNRKSSMVGGGKTTKTIKGRQHGGWNDQKEMKKKYNEWRKNRMARLDLPT